MWSIHMIPKTEAFARCTKSRDFGTYKLCRVIRLCWGGGFGINIGSSAVPVCMVIMGSSSGGSCVPLVLEEAESC